MSFESNISAIFQRHTRARSPMPTKPEPTPDPHAAVNRIVKTLKPFPSEKRAQILKLVADLAELGRGE